MPQYFPKNVDAFVRFLIVGGSVFAVVAIVLIALFARTTNNQVRVPVEQPVAFAHNLHAGQLGLDCRYCHTSVETSAFAGVPPTETCMTCHSQIRVGSPELEVVRRSWEERVPIEWNRVHDLPDYVVFDHSAHVGNGVGCASCHGPVDRMDGMWKNEPLTMGWCLECHRAPEMQMRPRSEVFNMDYVRPSSNDDQAALGEALIDAYHVDTEKLIQCSTCHR